MRYRIVWEQEVDMPADFNPDSTSIFADEIFYAVDDIRFAAQLGLTFNYLERVK